MIFQRLSSYGLCYFIFLSLCCHLIYAQTLFSHSIGGLVENEYCLDALLLSGGNHFLFAGSNSLIGPYYPDNDGGGLIGMADTFGNLQWLKEYTYINSAGKEKAIVLSAILDAKDNHFWIGGTFQKGHSLGVLMKIDSIGNIKMQQLYNYDAIHYPTLTFKNITYSTSGHLLVTGFAGKGSSDYDILCMKTDTTGHPIFMKQIGNFRDDRPIAIFPADNDGCIVVTAVGNLDQVDAFTRIYRLDSLGNIIWVEKFRFIYNTLTTAAIKIHDNGYVLTGNGLDRSFLVRMDSDLNVLWVKSYDLQDISTIAENELHQFILGGDTEYDYFAYRQNMIMVVDSEGNFVNAEYVSHLPFWDERVVKILPISSSKNIILGNVQAYDNVNYIDLHDIQFFTTDKNLQSICPFSSITGVASMDSVEISEDNVYSFDIPFILGTEPFLIASYDSITDRCSMPTLNEQLSKPVMLMPFPNPADGYVQFSLPSFSTESVILSLQDTNGCTTLNEVGCNQGIVTINTTGLSDGLYLYCLRTGSGTSYTGKFIIHKF